MHCGWFPRLLIALVLVVRPAYAQENIVGGNVYAAAAAKSCVATPILLTTVGSGTWNNNTGCTSFIIEAIGGGASGGSATAAHGTGGGGGLWTKTSATIPAGNVGYSIGAGGASATGGNGNIGLNSWICNSTSNCTGIADTAVVACAFGASRGNAGSGNISGGAGASNSAPCGTGGGGLASAAFAGGSGGNLTGASGAGSSGGGGAGGENGQGNNGVSSSAIVLTATNGGSGDGGFGGAAGVGSTTAAGTAGGNGTELTGCSWGSGGGGGASSIAGTGTPGGGVGGNYGGGGSGADNTTGTNPSGAGQQGAICILPQGGTYTGPGDIVPGASMWWGVRAYTASIAKAGTQKVVNVRNTGTNETCDVLVTSNGGLASTVTNCSGASSGALLATFCASCAIATDYDQTVGNACGGASCDLVQATAANQPALVLNCVNSLPCVQYTTSTMALTSANNFTPNASLIGTISSVGDRASSTGNTRWVAYGAATNRVTSNTSANTRLLVGGSGTITVSTATDAKWNAANGVINGASSVMNVNGAETTGTVTGSSTASAPNVADTGGNTDDVTDSGIWDNLGFGPTQRTAICQNQQAYYGAGNFGAAC